MALPNFLARKTAEMSANIELKIVIKYFIITNVSIRMFRNY